MNGNKKLYALIDCKKFISSNETYMNKIAHDNYLSLEEINKEFFDYVLSPFNFLHSPLELCIQDITEDKELAMSAVKARTTGITHNFKSNKKGITFTFSMILEYEIYPHIYDELLDKKADFLEILKKCTLGELIATSIEGR